MAEKPNILFIFADDMRFDTIQALGNSDISTPHIDRLCAGGTAFTHAHISGGTCGAVCMPSRAMLHTGKDLFRLHDRGASVPADQTLLGEHLGKHGYETYGTGKWHNGPSAFNRSFQDGGEIMFGGMGDHWNVAANSYDPEGRYDRLQPVIETPFTGKDVKYRLTDHIIPGKHSTDLFTDDALSFLDRRDSSKPFFLYLSFMAPHDPRSMPEKYLEMYDPGNIRLPENFMPDHPFDIAHKDIRDEKLAPFPREENDTKQQIAEYYAMITHLDDRIGDLVSRLKEQGEYDNTIVIFAADNGLAVGQHGLFGKQNMYDHSVRVPLVFAGPGIPENTRNGAGVLVSDIFPTLCDFLDLDIPESVESQSFCSTLKGQTEQHREYIYTAYTGIQRAVRKNEWKLIRCNINGQITHQLFDLKSDPKEMTNLFALPKHQDTAENLLRLMRRCSSESGEMQTEWKTFWENG